MYYPLTSLSNGALCQCGGLRDDHGSVALGDYFSTAIVNRWDSAQHSSEYPTDAFGELQFAGASKRHSYVGGLSVLFSEWLYIIRVYDQMPNNDSNAPRAVVVFNLPLHLSK